MVMTQVISNSDDIVDSRDVIARIEDLESDEDRDKDEQDELDALIALRDEAAGYAPDWEFGEALIKDSYFEAYTEQLADDIGAIDSNATWPLNCINWDLAASELQLDYTSVEWDGVAYWIR